MKSIGIGVIGWGFMGKTHTHALRAIPLFYPGIAFEPRLVSVCSRRLDVAQQARDSLGFLHATDDFRELIRRDDVDVVSICTPNADHERMALCAIEAGKHVYLDKPVSTDYASAQRIADAARAAGVKAQVVLNNRFLPATMRARQLVDEGRIGDVLSFGVRYLHSGSIDPNKPVGWKQLQGAGVLLDLGSHALDMARWLCGEPTELLCNLRTLFPQRPAPGGGTTSELGDDQCLILLKLANGATGSVEASKIATGAEDELSFELYGSRGALRFNTMEPGYLWFFDNTRPDVALGGERGFTRIACTARYPEPGGKFLPPKNAIGWDRAHIHCYYSFLHCVAHDLPPSPDLQDGARIQHLMELCAQSHAAKRWVEA